MALPPKVYQFLVGLFASLGSLLYGYDLGVMAQVIASDAYKRYFNDPSSSETGAVVAVFTGGAFFGAGFGGPIGDWLGRRLTIMAGAIVSTPKLHHPFAICVNDMMNRSSCSAVPSKLAPRTLDT
jgi:MFS family permease